MLTKLAKIPVVLCVALIGMVKQRVFLYFGGGISIFEGGKVRKKVKCYPNTIGRRRSMANVAIQIF